MKLYINKIFKTLFLIFIFSTLMNDIIKNYFSLIAITVQSLIPNPSLFSPIKELSMVSLILIPSLKNVVNKRYKINSYFLYAILFIILSIFGSLISILISNGNVGIESLGVLTGTIPNSTIGTNDFKIEYFLFFIRWISPILIAFAYYDSTIIEENKDFIVKVIKFLGIFFAIFTIENLFLGTCIQNRCRSLFYSTNSLGFNSLCLILITYKLVGIRIFSKKYIIIIISSFFSLIASLSIANITSALIFFIPFIIRFRNNIKSKLKNYKNILFLPIFIPPLIKITNLINNRGVFNLNSTLYNESLFLRIKIIGNSLNKSDGSLNIFGQKGLYTNIGRNYDTNIGFISDNLLGSIIGNFGIIILPIIIITIFIILYNYLLLFKSNMNIKKIDFGNTNLIIFCLFISGIGANIFEIQPASSILGCVLFNNIRNI